MPFGNQRLSELGQEPGRPLSHHRGPAHGIPRFVQFEVPSQHHACRFLNFQFSSSLVFVSSCVKVAFTTTQGAPMADKPIALKVLLRQKHLQGHRAFCKEYNKLAEQIEPELVGSWPSRAQFYRWLARDLQGLPYAHHCRILEAMFPGWTAEQLFQEHTGDIILGSGALPTARDNVVHSPKPVMPSSQGMADVTAVFPSRSTFSHELPPHKLFDGAKRIGMVGLSLNLLCQNYPDRFLLDLLESGTVVQCLFLDPSGRYIKEREREESHLEGVLSTLTRLNIQTLQRLHDKLSSGARENLRIRTYDEAVRFNITVIDDATCVVQPYLPDARGVESPTFVIEKQQTGPPGLFETFSRVFESMWARSKEITT